MAKNIPLTFFTNMLNTFDPVPYWWHLIGYEGKPEAAAQKNGKVSFTFSETLTRLSGHHLGQRLCW